MPDPWDQHGYQIRFDWGPEGARRITAELLVVVDVLSFSTAVDVLTARGVEVIPSPWDDDRAGELADRHGAALAVGRREVDAEHPWSLSPAALLAAPFTERLVLPSPNGSSVASGSAGDVVAACLRNADAVAGWIAEREIGSVAVVAAGERWPAGSLRPAVEDLLGAGAVISALMGRTKLTASPEAFTAAAAYVGTPGVPTGLRQCASAVELHDAGFGADVEVAAALGASACVPLARPGRGFTDASTRQLRRDTLPGPRQS